MAPWYQLAVVPEPLKNVILRSMNYFRRLLLYWTMFNCLEDAPMKQWQKVTKFFPLKGRVSVGIPCFWRVRQLQIRTKIIRRWNTGTGKHNLTKKDKKKKTCSCVGSGFSCFVSDTDKISKLLILWMEEFGNPHTGHTFQTSDMKTSVESKLR